MSNDITFLVSESGLKYSSDLPFSTSVDQCSRNITPIFVDMTCLRGFAEVLVYFGGNALLL